MVTGHAERRRDLDTGTQGHSQAEGTPQEGTEEINLGPHAPASLHPLRLPLAKPNWKPESLVVSGPCMSDARGGVGWRGEGSGNRGQTRLQHTGHSVSLHAFSIYASQGHPVKH